MPPGGLALSASSNSSCSSRGGSDRGVHAHTYVCICVCVHVCLCVFVPVTDCPKGGSRVGQSRSGGRRRPRGSPGKLHCPSAPRPSQDPRASLRGGMLRKSGPGLQSPCHHDAGQTSEPSAEPCHPWTSRNWASSTMGYTPHGPKDHCLLSNRCHPGLKLNTLAHRLTRSFNSPGRDSY